jgi:hypothetical protein
MGVPRGIVFSQDTVQVDIDEMVECVGVKQNFGLGTEDQIGHEVREE